MKPSSFPDPQVREALAKVVDPELGYSILDLGLVRGLEPLPSGKGYKLSLTLTSPMCPMGPEIVQSCKEALLGVEGVEEAEVELVWVPPWDPRVDLSEELKGEFGIWD